MEIPVQGAVLKWAREYRGLSLDEAAGRLGLTADALKAFEAGLKKPNLTQFEKFGSAYRLPLCTLFRKTPPEEPPKPTDFRTVGGIGHKDSFDFAVAESRIRSFQSVLRLLLQSEILCKAWVLGQSVDFARHLARQLPRLDVLKALDLHKPPTAEP